jgi:hypothetical protein
MRPSPARTPGTSASGVLLALQAVAQVLRALLNAVRSVAVWCGVAARGSSSAGKG